MYSAVNFVTVFRALFFEAALSGSTKSLNRYISSFYSVNTIDFNTERTALHFAVLGQNKENIFYLLSKNASRYAVDCYGNTPLHYAALSTDTSIISVLFSCFEDLNILNNSGSSPLALARSIDNRALIDFATPLILATRAYGSKVYLKQLHEKFSEDLVSLDDIFCCPITFDLLPTRPCAVRGSSRWWQVYNYDSLIKCRNNPLTNEELSINNIVLLDRDELKAFYEEVKSKTDVLKLTEAKEICSFRSTSDISGKGSISFPPWSKP